MRVLLIESDAEDALFLRDVLMEIAEGGYWNKWVHIEMQCAGKWSEASAMLSNHAPDIVLLNLDLPDSKGIETFRLAKDAARGIPIILLISESEEALGLRLVRDGAQDFLVKKQVDCGPLAHAMKNAMERQRFLTAVHASLARDTLTGLLNREGFLTVAERDRQNAERLGRRLMVIVAEPKYAGDTEHGRDLVMIEAADRLRSLIGPADVLARIESTRFGVTVFDTDQESLETGWERIRADLDQYRIEAGAAMFSTDHPATLDTLLEQAAKDLAPKALVMRT